MKTSRKQLLWQILIITTPEAEDAAAEALVAELGVPASSYTDAETHVTQVSAYLNAKPARLNTVLSAIRGKMRAAKRAGLRIGSGWVEMRPLKRENWAESWKRHFKPMSIGGKLLLRPSWTRRKARPGQRVIVLDPGLSFGTGHHATTSFCLRELVRFCRGGRGSFLDMGTGSGILAVAAAKLGCPYVEAFDFDPEAVRVARKNAMRNRVQAKVKIEQADVTQLPRTPARRFDLVCANLISDLLMAERERIVARVALGGTLVLAGILATEFDEVRRTFESNDMKLVRQRNEREWASGTFIRVTTGRRRVSPWIRI